ncbi:hypothetical protein Ccrd_020909 [Cynara cardunculus var. scolymus]|uniref:Uncharacterized protein n=1 Tax=Cynara cardunculus var. scolymus TaxID=59895 RepID=A0A103Y1L3_CYNCS|nr:hypothetical protein Ccrd_020909 [Cynara cardunculus var. scolymus]
MNKSRVTTVFAVQEFAGLLLLVVDLDSQLKEAIIQQAAITPAVTIILVPTVAPVQKPAVITISRICWFATIGG